jgi:hypothetical protein
MLTTTSNNQTKVFSLSVSPSCVELAGAHATPAFSFDHLAAAAG